MFMAEDKKGMQYGYGSQAFFRGADRDQTGDFLLDNTCFFQNYLSYYFHHILQKIIKRSADPPFLVNWIPLVFQPTVGGKSYDPVVGWNRSCLQ